jgi:endonuclease/exonuclease/phosphatase family metal-dependent hydrolase
MERSQPMSPRFFYATLIGITALFSMSCVSMETCSSLGSHRHSVKEGSDCDSHSHFISWNVHKAKTQVFTQDVRTLLAEIPEGNNLTLCLQESRSTTFDRITGLHREEVSGHYAPSWRFPFARESTGVLTVGNQVLPHSGVLRVPSPCRELYVASPKVSLRSEIPLDDGRQLQIVNCHGLNFVRISSLPDQLDKIFGSLQCSKSPAIVCGDFNAWSEERLQLLNQKAMDAGLAEAHPRGDEHSPAPKWLGWMKRFNGFDPKIRLDRIYTRGIEVTDCYSHPGVRSSDHLPLIMSYRVLPEG